MMFWMSCFSESSDDDIEFIGISHDSLSDVTVGPTVVKTEVKTEPDINSCEQTSAYVDEVTWEMLSTS